MNYQLRLSKVRERIKSAGLDVLILTEPHNIFYLSGSNGGYTGARTALVVDHEKSILLIDSRYIEETRVTASADSIQIWGSAGYADVVNVVARSGGLYETGEPRAEDKSITKMVGFEATHITVKQFERLSFEFAELAGFTGSTELNGSVKPKKLITESVESAKPMESATEPVELARAAVAKGTKGLKPEFRLVGTTGIVETVREVKDQKEIARIQAAARIADLAFDYISGLIKPGMTEKEIALELDYFMLRNGAERVSFDTIVASGKNSAVPHATPSQKKIEMGDFVKLDFGAVVELSLIHI
jgi:Xaa-Pro aminopeptidase